jgi:hypothetical protein
MLSSFCAAADIILQIIIITQRPLYRQFVVSIHILPRMGQLGSSRIIAQLSGIPGLAVFAMPLLINSHIFKMSIAFATPHLFCHNDCSF